MMRQSAFWYFIWAGAFAWLVLSSMLAAERDHVLAADCPCPPSTPVTASTPIRTAPTTTPSTQPTTKPAPPAAWFYPDADPDGVVRIPEGQAIWFDAVSLADLGEVWQGKLTPIANFGNGSSQYNVIRGLATAHRPNHTGKFHCVLTLTDGKSTTTDRPQNVEVVADTRPILYVDPAGDDHADGSQSHPLRSVAVAIARGDRIALHGGRHVVNDSLFVLRPHVSLASYAGRAQLHNTSRSVTLRVQADFCTVRGIDFSSPRTTNRVGNAGDDVPGAIRLERGGGLVVEDCGADQIGTFVELLYGVHHVLLLNNDIRDIRAYGLYDGGATDVVWLGGKCADPKREHCARLHGAGLTIWDANLTNTAGPNGDTQKPCISFTSNACAGWVESCDLNGGVRIGPQDPVAKTVPAPQRPLTGITKCIVIRGNRIANATIDLVGGATHTLIESNQMTQRNWSDIRISDSPDSSGRIVNGLLILNNTGNNPGDSGLFLEINGLPIRTMVWGNTWIAPNVARDKNPISCPEGADVDVPGQWSDHANRWVLGTQAASQPTTKP